VLGDAIALIGRGFERPGGEGVPIIPRAG